ncbi:MAG: S-layer homology domain-containing protein [Thioalkalivibrio sp.]|nr:S-layer homology domain-containing protein [Thioalkalivibrio sp.]
MSEASRYGLGALPDPPDDRDFQVFKLVHRPVTVPAMYSPGRSTVRNQGSLGSCVGFGGAAQDERLHGVSDLSEQALYGWCKEIDGWPGEGTYPRTMYSILAKRGCPEENYHPYEGRYPPANQNLPGTDENAARYRIATYAAIPKSYDDLLAARYAVGEKGAIGVTIYVYYSMAYNTRSDGVIPMPSGDQLGAHFMCFDGGWNAKGMEVKNSWSKYWGDKGYCWISREVWDAIGISAWTVVDDELITKWWKDWPDTNLVEQDVVYKSKAFLGYPDGTFRPWNDVTRGQVWLVANRIGIAVPPIPVDDYYRPAQRGWVRDTIPGLTWDSERFTETLTRFQLVLLVARKLQGR